MTIVNTIIVVSPRITELLNIVRFTGLCLEYIWSVRSMEGCRYPSHTVGIGKLEDTHFRNLKEHGWRAL